MSDFFFRIDELLPPFEMIDHVVMRFPRTRSRDVGAGSSRLIVFMEGELDLCVEGQPVVRVGPGTALVFPAPCRYHYYPYPRNRTVQCRALRVNFHSRESERVPMSDFEKSVWGLMAGFRSPVHVFHNVFSPYFLQMVNRLNTEAGASGEAHRLAATGLCSDILIHLSRLRDRPHEKKAQAWRSAETGVEIAKQYILGHLDQPLTREILAEYVGWSREHLSRCFKHVTGETVLDYVRKHRVERAKVLLTQKGRSIDRIARDAGFAGGHALHRVFKKHVGMTPGAFRNSVRRRSRTRR